MLSLSDNNQTDIIEAFNSTSRYLDDLLNIDNPYIEQMVGQIYPPKLQLNKANSSDTEAPFLDLNLSITKGIVSSKIYDKRDDLNFEIRGSVKNNWALPHNILVWYCRQQMWLFSISVICHRCFDPEE